MNEEKLLDVSDKVVPSNTFLDSSGDSLLIIQQLQV